MQFAQPIFLWLIPPIVAGLLLFFRWSTHKHHDLMSRFIQARLLPNLVINLSPPRRKVRAGLIIGAVVCSLLALARPQWGFVWEEARLKGLDIVVAIDTSKSMLAADIAPNRLTRAKLAALDLLKLASSDRLGLVAFAGSAFLQCPLTIDEATFSQAVQALEVGIIPTGGTAIGAAIETALTAFREGDNHKVLVIFSDGEDQDTDALEAAKRAGEAGLIIYTIGLGTAEGELLRIRLADGRTDFVRDEEGNVVKSRLNEDLLRQVASATTGGFYLPLRGAKTIETLYDEALSKLPKSDLQERFVRRYQERFHWPLGLALLLLGAEMLVGESARTRTRRSAEARAARVAPATATALLVALAGLGNAQAATPQEAFQHYQAGHYDRAQRAYEELLKKGADPRLSFNAGAAAYRNGKFEEAIKHFSDAANSPDLKLQQDGYYNRGNAHYQKGEQAAEREAKMEAWKKALQDFQSTLKLDPQDSNADFNKDWVQRRLKELEQQPPPQSQQQQDNKENEDQDQQEQNQQDQPQQQNQEQEKQQDQQQSQAQSQQQQHGQDQQQQADQNQPQDQSNQPEHQQGEPKAEKSREQKPPDQQKKQGSAGKEQEEQAEAAGETPNHMSPEDARRLLDSQKGDEKLLPANKGQQGDLRRPLRDW